MNLKKNLMKKFAGVCGIVVIMMVMMPIVTAPVMAATRKMPKMIYTDTNEPVPESSEGYQVDPGQGWIHLYASGVTITGASDYTLYIHGDNYVVHDYYSPNEIFSLGSSTVELGDNNTFGNFVASGTLTLKGQGTQKIRTVMGVNNLTIQANGTLTFQPITSRYIYGAIRGVLKVTSGTFVYKGDSTNKSKSFFRLENNGRIELQNGYMMKGAASPTATSLSDLTMNVYMNGSDTCYYYTVTNANDITTLAAVIISARVIVLTNLLLNFIAMILSFIL